MLTGAASWAKRARSTRRACGGSRSALSSSPSCEGAKGEGVLGEREREGREGGRKRAREREREGERKRERRGERERGKGIRTTKYVWYILKIVLNRMRRIV